MHSCTIIGISDSRNQWFEPKVLDIIKAGKVFSGGKRHHEIMQEFLPQGALWIDITVPLSDVFRQYEAHEDVVIFASGDPLFFGFAATVQREVPGCQISVYPYFNSLQMLAHRMCLPYQDMHVVSLTGRPWDKFDEALINGEPLIGCLTDKNKTPFAIWQHMQEYGYDNYDMTVGECLGNEQERLTTIKATLPVLPATNEERQPAASEECQPAISEDSEPKAGEECQTAASEDSIKDSHPQKDRTWSFSTPNCLILRMTSHKEKHFGIPESDFALLNGRVNMITKAPIRLVTLSALDLANARTFWDIGFCTGSVSIEAKMQFPNLHIESFEVRSECEDIMAKNMRHFGTPGINVHIGDFLEEDLSALPVPDSVFIGGHGGRLIEIIGKVLEHAHKDREDRHHIRFVINAVSDKSVNLMYEAAEKYKMMLISDNRIVLDDHNPINIITFAS